jgi:hypothetical protein
VGRWMSFGLVDGVLLRISCESKMMTCLWFFAFCVGKDVGAEQRVDIVLFIIRGVSRRGLLLDILHLPFRSMNMLVFLSIRMFVRGGKPSEHARRARL